MSNDKGKRKGVILKKIVIGFKGADKSRVPGGVRKKEKESRSEVGQSGWKIKKRRIHQKGFRSGGEKPFKHRRKAKVKDRRAARRKIQNGHEN